MPDEDEKPIGLEQVPDEDITGIDSYQASVAVLN
jgi:hypothetical protein